KKEISTKIFGFWGHIHITDTDINRSLLEAYPISKGQPFYPSLDTVGRLQYFQEEEWLGYRVARRKQTKGGISHIQVFAIKPGIIERAGRAARRSKASSSRA